MLLSSTNLNARGLYWRGKYYFTPNIYKITIPHFTFAGGKISSVSNRTNNLSKENIPSTSRDSIEFPNFEDHASTLSRSPSIIPNLILTNQIDTALNTENSDIIEPSEEETLDSYILKSLQSKKRYTDLSIVPLLNVDENRRQSVDISDFSSDSDEVYIPENLLSDTDISVSDIVTAERNHSPQALRESQEIIERNVIEEIPVTSRKRKQFPPKENKSKKRPRDENKWKKKVAALARERGEEYLSYNNIVKPRKTIKEGAVCHLKCRMKCSSKFDRDERQSILKDFYKLDVNSKNALLFSAIVSKPVARRRTNAKKQKSATFKYFITHKGVTKEVCKLGLCGLYQISRKKVDIIIQKIKSGASAPTPDRRGKHNNRPHKADDEVVQRIKQHISSFPAEQSHYSRSKNIYKLYLSPLLNVTKMYELYIEMCKEQKLQAKYEIKKSTYNKVFVTEFNLSFGYPKSDTCATCDSGNSNEEHKANYRAAVEAMATDRKKPTKKTGLLYLTIDLQQTMPLPKIPTSKAFYLRQIWFYNLGIHVVDTTKEKAVCCTWTEDVADRGSAEVASALLRFVEVDPSCRNKDHLLIWSDSCAGQNKNFNIIVLYQYMIKKGYFKIIDHKFPEVGHSYLDSDRDFGRIEKVLRKHEAVYAPEQYREIICKASRNNVVIDMTDHFRKINDLQNQLNLINRKKDENKQKVNFRDGIKWIRVEEFGAYLYKESYDEMTPFRKVDILKKRGHVEDVEVERVGRKYGTISEEKKENIKEQIKFVKPEYRYYYQNIIE